MAKPMLPSYPALFHRFSKKTSCQISERFLEPFPRKSITYVPTDARTYGSDSIGTLGLQPGTNNENSRETITFLREENTNFL